VSVNANLEYDEEFQKARAYSRVGVELVRVYN